MLTNLLNRMLISELNQLELVPAGPSIGRNFDAYAYCTDGSCSGDCVGGCDGTPAGGNRGGAYCSDGSCSGDCVGGCDGTPAGGF